MDEHILSYYRLYCLRVKSKRTFFIECLTFFILRFRWTPFLLNRFMFRYNISSRDTRIDILTLPLCQIEIFKWFFRCTKASKLWNDISLDIFIDDNKKFIVLYFFFTGKIHILWNLIVHNFNQDRITLFWSYNYNNEIKMTTIINKIFAEKIKIS